MNKLIVPIFFIACLFMTSCNNDDESKDKSELIRMWVSAQTTMASLGGNDDYDHPVECMQVRYSSDGQWEPMAMGAIENFQYEKGSEYELSVIKTTLVNPPADGSDFTYRLDRIISYRVVSATMVGLDHYIEIPSNGKEFDIDFTTNAPCEIARITGDIFGESELIELYDTGYGNGYSLRLKIPQNTGMGRVKLLTLRFSNGDEKKIGIWQMPRDFSATETFELPYSGSLGYMIGTDQSNFGKIRNIKIIGAMNANDAYYLCRILQSHGYQGYGELPEYVVDLMHSGFASGSKSKYADCGICDVEIKYLPPVYPGEVPSSVFTSNKYVTEVNLPEDIKAINSNAFSHCTALRRINIPSGCIEIGSYAFSTCPSLENVEFPYISSEVDLPRLQIIGSYAFSNVGHLKSFVLPESLKIVARTALSFTAEKLFSLSEVPPVWTVPGNAGDVLGPKPDGCTLYVPFGCAEAYRKSEKWGKFHIEEMPEDKWWEMIP